MITVRIKKKSNLIMGFEIKGHALSEEIMDSLVGEAYDMVCNSVSVLSQSIVIGLEEVLNLKSCYDIEDGFLKVNLSAFPKEDLEKAQILMKTFELSLYSITESLKVSLKNNKGMIYINVIKEEV